MRHFSFWAFVLVLLFTFLVGCTSRIPEPVSYPYSQQRKMQASGHWEVLAYDLANRINNELILSDNMATTVYVKPTCGDESHPCEPHHTSSFNEAFRDLLITGLYSYGIPTAKQQLTDAIKVEYKVQVVRHNGTRIRTIQPGLLTALSAAILVLRDAPSEILLLATGAAADVINTSFSTKSQYEVIITTSIVDKGTFLFRASDIYYINDKDFHHYIDHKPQTKTITLSSGNEEEKEEPPSTFPYVDPKLLEPPKEEGDTKTGI